MTSEERWAAVPGYVGAYEVSSHGRVRSLSRTSKGGRRIEGQILAPNRMPSGHVLTDDQIPAIRGLLGTVPDAEIGRRFGVDRGTIRAIRVGKTWSHVP